MKSPLSPALLAALFLAAGPAALRAQSGDESEPAGELDPVVVRSAAPRPAPAAPPILPPSVASAPPPPAPEALAEAPSTLTVPDRAAAAESLRLTPGGAGTVDSESYKEGRAANLKDALDFAPGVYVQPRFGAEESRISIRGSGIQRTFHGRGLRLLQDGVPLNLADGGFDMQAVEPLSTDYIEIHRGANALRYGAATLGGAVNFVSHTGWNAPPWQGRFEAGSFDTLRGQVSAAGAEGPLDWYATATHFSTDGFRDHSRQSNQRFFSNVGHRLGEDAETRFFFAFVATDSELPGALTKEQLRDDPRQAATSAVPIFDHVLSDWKRDFDLFRASNRTSFRLGPERQLDIVSFYSYKHLDHPILFVIDQVSHDFGVGLHYVDSGDRAGRENRLILGVLPHFNRVRDTRFANVFGKRGAQFADNAQQSLNLDFYGENVHFLADRLAAVLGAQISYARRDNDDRFPGGLTSDRQDWWGFSPKAGLLHETTDTVQTFANLSRSFEPPSFGELTAPAMGGAGLVDLDAQTATTLEIGTRGRSPGGRIAWDAAWYYSWLDAELLTLSVAPGLTQTVNAGDTRHQGVEFGMEFSLLEGLVTGGGGGGGGPALPSGKAGADPGGKHFPGAGADPSADRLVFRHNYLWHDFRFRGDPEFGNNRLPGIPEHYYRAELLYRHPSGFYAGPHVEFSFGNWFVDSANTLSADSYALLGFKAGYRTPRGLSLFVEARNLTDEIYAATTGAIHTAGPFNSNQFLPGDGRSLYFGMEYRF